jgi:NitT/TauT family transport system ATP-binding protein
MSAIELRDVSISYEKNDETFVAVDHVNLNVKSGEFITLLGPSGCGKSSLLMAIDGLLKKSGGEILVDGRPVVGPGSDRAMVFQEFSLMPWRNARDNVAFGMEMLHVGKSERNRRAVELLKMVGLEGREKSHPHELSGGQKQRVGIARALAVQPRVLLMDEPFGALDAYSRELMSEELSNIWENDKKTVIFVTHSIDEAIVLGDRVVVMGGRPGHVLEEIEVDLPRPRALSLRDSEEFLEYRRRVSALLFGEAQASMDGAFAASSTSVGAPE